MGIGTRLAALALAASLAGCQTAGTSGAAGDGDSARLAAAGEDYRRTVSEGVALGAVVGGVAGALIGGARGDENDMLRGALIGTLVGGALGGAGGAAVAENKRGFAAAENRLDAEIAEARAARGKLQSLVSVARRLVAKRRAEAAALRAAGPARAAERRALLAQVTENGRVLDASIAGAEREKSRLQRVAASYGAAAGGRTLAGEAAATSEAARSLAREREALGRIGEDLR